MLCVFKGKNKTSAIRTVLPYNYKYLNGSFWHKAEVGSQ